ncbi:MAG: hypothetical protein AAFP92_31170, partial [Bacteroidota bacterium]
PSDQEAARKQRLQPILSAAQIKAVFAGEKVLEFRPLPFSTITEEIPRATSFWQEFGALEEIQADQCLIIADFEIGSDSMVILDYADDFQRPLVKWLKWTAKETHWVVVAPDFGEFMRLLGLG